MKEWQNMLKNISAATRYLLIDQMLNDKRKPYPSLEQLAARNIAI
jgi:hypothetical protein